MPDSANLQSPSLEEELAGLYNVWLDRLPANFDFVLTHGDQLMTTCADNAADTEELHRVAHDFKGQAGQFGYTLLAQVGDRICAQLRKNETMAANRLLPVIKAHFLAARFIVNKRIVGSGGDAGQAIIDRLDKLSQQLEADAS